MIEEFCHYCQIKDQAPRRFKFSLKDDKEFNNEIVVDIMYLESNPVLHVIDWATAFQAARFLESMSALHTWEALRPCWIYTYLGPPDAVTHDPGTNLASTESKASAKLMGITCVQIPIGAHHSIGKVERYHAPLRRAFEIITAELGNAVSRDVRLQMALKACNDTTGPDGLVPTLLVFGAYPRMTPDYPPSQRTIARAVAVSEQGYARVAQASG